MKFLIIFFLIPASFLYSLDIKITETTVQQPPVRNVIPTDPPPQGRVTQITIQDWQYSNQYQSDNEPESIVLQEIIGQVANRAIKIVPETPDPKSNKVYRVQAGAFRNAAFAQNCFDRVKAAGLSPGFELHDGIYRVVIPSVYAADIGHVALRLDLQGFTEILLREER